VTLLLARHGETDDNIEPIRIQGRIDTPLNATGRAQAAELAERVVPERVTGIWCSQLSRAKETAEIVGRRVGIEPIVDPRLAEGNRGRLEGRLWEEVARSEPNTYAAWRAAGEEFRFPQGESLKEQQDRVLAALSEIRAAGPGPSLVVCHGGSIRVVLCASDPEGLRAFHRFDIPNVALIRL
jgi:broad specificity phosphatase PhoE